MTDATNSKVRAGDWDSLARDLRAAGLEEATVDRLSEAIRLDIAEGQTGLGSRGTAWLGGLRVQAAHGLAEVHSVTVSGLVVDALTIYFRR